MAFLLIGNDSILCNAQIKFACDQCGTWECRALFLKMMSSLVTFHSSSGSQMTMSASMPVLRAPFLACSPASRAVLADIRRLTSWTVRPRRLASVQNTGRSAVDIHTRHTNIDIYTYIVGTQISVYTHDTAASSVQNNGKFAAPGRGTHTS